MLGPVRRLELSFADHQWIVRREVRVNRMRLPVTQPRPQLEKGRELLGTWYEVYAKDDGLLYRRRIFLPDSLEIFDPGKGIRREPLPPARWDILEILVPDLSEAVEVRLFSNEVSSLIKSPLPRGRGDSPVAVIDLQRDYRERKGGPDEY